MSLKIKKPVLIESEVLLNDLDDLLMKSKISSPRRALDHKKALDVAKKLRLINKHKRCNNLHDQNVINTMNTLDMLIDIMTSMVRDMRLKIKDL